MMAEKLSTTQKIFLGLFLITVFAYCFNIFKEPDAFYHLKAGQFILESGTIPNTDPFSFVSQGATWIPHEWLGEIVLFLSYYLAGFWGVIIFGALLGFLAGLILFKTCRKRGVNFYISIIGILLLNALTFELWIGRPQIFSFLFASLFVYLLENFRISGKKINLVLIGVTTLVWANMHAGFILGIAIVFAYLLGGIFNHYFRLNSAMDRLKLRWLSFLFLSLPLISLLNPSGYKIFTYSFVILPAVSKLKIMEWSSIIDYLYLNEARIYLAQILLFGLLGLYWFLFKKERRDYIISFLFLGVCLLPFISIRHVGLWPVVLTPFILGAVDKFIFVRIENRFNSKDFGVVLGIVLIVFLVPKLILFPKKYYNHFTIPNGAIEFVKSEKLEGPIFNLYNDGGYLIWSLYPEKIFIDGRSEVYSLDKLDDYLAITGGAPHWKELVDDKYKLEYFFISYRGNSKGLIPLVYNLEKEDWKLIYWDDLSIIYVRNNKQNSEIIDKYGINFVGPFRDASKLSDEDKRLAFGELNSLLGRVENSEIIQEYAKSLMFSK